MIIVNNLYAFQSEGLSEKPSLEQFATQKRSTVGYLVTTQSQIVSNEKSYTLLVTRQERTWLEDMLPFLGAFNFVDESAFSWIVTPGTDDANHAYNTGAYFLAPTKLIFVPQQANGALACDQRWQVDVTFIINARGVRSANPTLNTYLFSETPAGTVNGTNPTFTLTVIPASLLLFRNGVLQDEGVDYTLVSQTITFMSGAIPQVGDILIAYYQT